MTRLRTQLRGRPLLYKGLILILMIGLAVPAGFAIAAPDSAPVAQDETCPNALSGYEGTAVATGAGNSSTQSFGSIAIAGDGGSVTFSTITEYTALAICLETDDGGTTLVEYSDLLREGSVAAPEGLLIERAVLYVNELEWVRPVLNCVVDNGDGTYTAWWGYRNDNSHVNVPLPVGEYNYFGPAPIDRGQATYFPENGSANFVFSATAPDGTTLTWTLIAFGLDYLTRSASATEESPLCDNPPPTFTPTPTETPVPPTETPTPTETPVEPTETPVEPTDGPGPTDTPEPPEPTDTPEPTNPPAEPTDEPPADVPPAQDEAVAEEQVVLPSLGASPVAAVNPAAGGLDAGLLLLGGLGTMLLGALRLAWGIIKRR